MVATAIFLSYNVTVIILFNPNSTEKSSYHRNCVILSRLHRHLIIINMCKLIKVNLLRHVIQQMPIPSKLTLSYMKSFSLNEPRQSMFWLLLEGKIQIASSRGRVLLLPRTCLDKAS